MPPEVGACEHPREGVQVNEEGGGIFATKETGEIGHAFGTASRAREIVPPEGGI
jgi:hypothetical protein